jgi:hypothetical protein
VTVARPTLAEVAARIPGGDPGQVRPLYDAAWEQQCHHCYTNPYHPDLAEALHRRVANLWASKGHTLGVLDTGTDFGVQFVPRYDPVIEALEGPHRRMVVA